MIQVSLDPNRQFIFELPYNLTLADVQLACSPDYNDLHGELRWLANNADEAELPRIMQAALILHQVVVPQPNMAACLHTAIIWERG